MASEVRVQAAAPGVVAGRVQRRAGLVLATGVREVGFTTEGLLGRHAQLAVLDLLYIAVAQRMFEQYREALAVTTEAVHRYKTDDGA